MAFCNSYASALESYVNNYGVATEGERFDMFKSGAKNLGRNIIDAIKRLFEMLRNAAARVIARIKDAIFRAKNRVKNKNKPEGDTKEARATNAANDARKLAALKKLVGTLNGAVPKYNALIRKVVTTSKSEEEETITARLDRIEEEKIRLNKAINQAANVGAMNGLGIAQSTAVGDAMEVLRTSATTSPHMYVQICSELNSILMKVQSTCETATKLADSLDPNGGSRSADEKKSSTGMARAGNLLRAVGSDFQQIITLCTKAAAGGSDASQAPTT